VTTKKQTAQNPFIATDAKHCAIPDCVDTPVWSPALSGAVCFCRRHANLPEPRVRSRSDLRARGAAIQRALWPEKFGAPLDREAQLERAAIMAEGSR